MAENTDLTFFTNEPGATLLDRFHKMLKDVRYFDVLVGYFRTSGFNALVPSLTDVEKIRILVGINVDGPINRFLEISRDTKTFDFDSHKRTKDAYTEGIINELEHSTDSYDVEISAIKFIELVQSGKLDIRAYPSGDVHAKVYISRFNENDRDYGRVITGSSNFSESGFVEKREFNVELKNSSDVRFALEKFELLWADAVDVTNEYIDTIKNKTWLSDQISPYQLYLKFLFEYLKDDINLDDELDPYLPPGFMELQYQKQAVFAAKKILETYNGVFLADVVGLGKTFIAAMLAQQLAGKILIICPPVLKSYWEETFQDFGVRGYRVESLGKLEHLLAEGTEKYEYVFIDEAHRFRNELTISYEMLHQICFRKKVVLVSATPLNNRFSDILSQIKLFQQPKNSTIPGITNLEKFFSSLSSQIDRFDKDDPEYREAIRTGSKEIRDKVLKFIMVRRTRTEIKKYYSEDMKQKGLSFPIVADPSRIVYKFDKKIDHIFNETIKLLREVRYSRYTPLIYFKKPLSEFELQSQRNLGGFMKGVLVKRLESSFHAFKMTLRRFVFSYEQFINMYRKGTVYISKKVNVYDLLDQDDEELLLQLVEQDKVQVYKVSDFRKDYFDALQHDLKVLRAIELLWKDTEKDPKLKEFIKELKTNEYLKAKKIILFTESKETGDYLYEQLNHQFKNQLMFYSSGGAIYNRKEEDVLYDREVIKHNFDPASKQAKDDIRILITTDVLAEGINLHRSNVVINYDLPWNPTRVLQRVGRVNRVGTSHKKIHIFNFFPTSQSDEHLGLEANIKAKIQAFHDTLGEDARYLTDEEQYSSHELFGESLYKRLNDKKTYEGEQEEEEKSELEYLKILRDVRDNEPAIFEKIKHLPPKCRTGREIKNLSKDSLISFFRKGKLKKFFITDGDHSKEITFFEAVDWYKCDKDTSKISIPPIYYQLLAANKKEFELTTTVEISEKQSRHGTSNEAYVVKRLKAKEIRIYHGFTDDDEAYIKSVLKAFDLGIIPRNTSKRLKELLEREIIPIKVLSILRKNIAPSLLGGDFTKKTNYASPLGEVILSEYFKVLE